MATGNQDQKTFMNETARHCFGLPPKINSGGVWENTASPSVILNYAMPLLELQMVLVFLVTQLSYFILKPLGFQRFPSHMIAGIILTLLGRLETFKAVLFPTNFGLEIIDTIALFGFSLFMFLMGVKMDVKDAFSTVKTAKVIGFLTLVASFMVGHVVQTVLKESNQTTELSIERDTLTTSQSLVSVQVIACLLSELKILNSELGRRALASALVGNVGGIVLALVMTFYRNLVTTTLETAVTNIGAMILFITALVFVLRPWMFRIIRRTPEGRPVKNVFLFTIVLQLLGSTIYADIFGLSPKFGAFLFGLVVPDGPPLGSALVDKIECIVSGVFLPLFVTTATMRADPVKMLTDTVDVKFATIIVIATFFTKLIATFIPSYLSKMPLNDSLAFALIMGNKGVVDLSFYADFRDDQVIGDASFTVMMIATLLNSTIVPMLVKLLYDPISRKYAGYEKRNIMHLKPNTELRILCCVHKPDNVTSMIGLLNATCPTEESPNGVYVLHLIELMGRDSPVFIDHQKHENEAVRSSYENFILAFDQYKRDHWGLVMVNAFTAISPRKLMHEDICDLALNKQTCIILIPFHRKLSSDGFVDEHNPIRYLNYSVLERAPCSVGILVDRGRMCRPSYRICTIFLGGKDDREALTLAIRMANDQYVELAVIRFVDEEDQYASMELGWDKMLDDQVLKDVKHGDDNIMYMEEVVRDGLQTAKFVKSIVDKYDLIIVGRRHKVECVQTSGLLDWSEFPELGVMGDLLASTDLDSTTSVLVVQQQNYIDVVKH